MFNSWVLFSFPLLFAQPFHNEFYFGDDVLATYDCLEGTSGIFRNGALVPTYLTSLDDVQCSVVQQQYISNYAIL